MKSYIGIIHIDNESDYGISFPDFPGCVSATPTLEDAKHLASEALQLHINAMVDDKIDIPSPSSLDSIMSIPDFQDGVALVVDVKVKKIVRKRVNITVEETLLQKIDHRSLSLHKDRSAYLSDLARADIEC